MAKSTWVREISRAYGIDDDRLDFDESTGYVTLDGKKLARPDYVEDGKSYFSDVTPLIEAFRGDTVGVADYAASKASPVALSYSDKGGARVNGKSVPTAYLSEGKAYAKKEDVDEALSARTAADVAKETRAYSDEILKLLKNAGTKEFSFDPENDAAYSAYTESLKNDLSRAIAEVIASYSGLTGGHVNSAAVTEAAKVAAGYAEDAASKLPDFYKLALERYQKETENALSLADAYERAAKLYRDTEEGAIEKDNEEIRKNRAYVEDRYDAEAARILAGAEAARKERELGLSEEKEKNRASEKGRELSLDEEKEKNRTSEKGRELSLSERSQSLAERKFETGLIESQAELSRKEKDALYDAVADAYAFIEKAFVSEETGINRNGIRLYLDSMSAYLPDDVRRGILKTYGA